MHVFKALCPVSKQVQLSPGIDIVVGKYIREGAVEKRLQHESHPQD